MGEGHYAAVLRRTGTKRLRRFHRNPRPNARRNLRFRGQTGAALPEEAAVRGRVLSRPAGAAGGKGLRVLRAGLELGAVLKNRFAPAHAWALWLETLESSVSFEEADPLLARYLSGDVLPSDKRGWTLVQADGLSLGWAKGDGSQLKNHYPKALRRPV
ncbi:MAG: RsmF rRNA methyltransferase first C-terminal domain-containing protein [Oscillospiraceae bacterium]